MRVRSSKIAIFAPADAVSFEILYETKIIMSEYVVPNGFSSTSKQTTLKSHFALYNCKLLGGGLMSLRSISRRSKVARSIVRRPNVRGQMTAVKCRASILDIQNGHNFATGLPIDVVFVTTVGFSGSAYLMMQHSMTLSDLEPQFQGHSIVQRRISRKRCMLRPNVSSALCVYDGYNYIVNDTNVARSLSIS